MKILVTGGAGFIGSHVVDALVARGHDVLVVDHYRKKKQRFPNPKARVVKRAFGHSSIADLLAYERPDAICHLAAQISVTRSIEDPRFDAQVNVMDTLRLLEAGARVGVSRFVFASSGGAIYGDYPLRPTPEVFDALPLSPYGISKQSVEHFLEGFQAMHELSPLALRFSNVYGPRQLPEGEAGVVAIFLDKLLRGQEAVIFGDGLATRDYLFVLDAAHALVLALEGQETGVVNVSTGVETSVRELWDQLVEMHAGEASVRHQGARSGEVQKSVLDPSTAKARLGWEPKTDIRSGLRETYTWFRERFKTL